MFASGVLVVQSLSHSEEAVIKHTAKLVSSTYIPLPYADGRVNYCTRLSVHVYHDCDSILWTVVKRFD